MEYTRLMIAIEKFVFQKKKMSWVFFSCKLFPMTLLSMRLQRAGDRKKNHLLEKFFFHWYLFSSKKVGSFGMIHQWGYREMILWTKVTVKKLCSFEKSVSPNNIFEWQIYKWGWGGLMLKTKKYFSTNFSLHRRLLSWKKNNEWYGKNYQRVAQERW